jgi:hypothetical protein
MANTRFSKVDAARRQIDAAISLHFTGGDFVAVHTLVGAGGRIVRDLCKRRCTPAYAQYEAAIRPGMLDKSLWALNKGANFFKHANEDPDKILEIDELANDGLIFLAIIFYMDLGELTSKMLAFHHWYSIVHPDQFSDTEREKLPLSLSDCHTWSREEQIRVGRELLQVASSAR